MSESVERQFPAKTLLLGLRAIGYSFSTAVADIIDNSISAEATEIKIYSDPLADIPYFCILDNGYGMTTKELDNAMLFGSNREDKEECELELGRFGLGLKSASLSQCRKFIVASKKYGKIRAMAFDLDLIDEKIVIKNQELKDLILQTNYACSTDESRLVLTGVNMKTIDNLLECSATDSYRLALKRLVIDKLFFIVVPGVKPSDFCTNLFGWMFSVKLSHSLEVYLCTCI